MVIIKIVKEVFRLIRATNKALLRKIQKPIRIIRATNYALKKAKLI